jgi:SM-20-related protein
LQQFEQLRRTLNQELLLGLFEFECHLSMYQPGARYARHLDQFRDDDRRRVSCVLYLNENWCTADGGELRIYADGTYRDVLPQGGTLVIFLSQQFEHEVLPAHRERYSLTGWFKLRQT